MQKSRSDVKCQGNKGQNKLAPNWAFTDCNSSFNLQTTTKWCTKLGGAWKTCPIVFRGHPSNFKVKRTEKNHGFELIWARLLDRSQLSNPSDLPCFGWYTLGFTNAKCNSDAISNILNVFCFSFQMIGLTQISWGQAMHRCVSKYAIIDSDNGLSLVSAKPLSEPMLSYCQVNPQGEPLAKF